MLDAAKPRVGRSKGHIVHSQGVLVADGNAMVVLLKGVGVIERERDALIGLDHTHGNMLIMLPRKQCKSCTTRWEKVWHPTTQAPKYKGRCRSTFR